MAQLVIHTVTMAPDPRPQQNDTHHAWNDRHIWRVHAEQFVKPTYMNDYQDMGGLLYKWFCKTCKYRFERRGKNTLIQIDQTNGDSELDVSGTMDIRLYLQRRKKFKRKPLWCLGSHGAWQSNREIWFSESKLWDKATIESFWDNELANDGKDKNDYRYLAIGNKAERFAFAAPTKDFDDSVITSYEENIEKAFGDCTTEEKAAYINALDFGASQPENEDVITTKYRKREVPIDSLGLKVSIDDLIDPTKTVDSLSVLQDEDDIDLSKVTVLKDKKTLGVI